MILLDTHIWVWWMDGSSQLPPAYSTFIQAEEANCLAVSAISCWEVAKLAGSGRIRWSIPVEQWLASALQPPVQLIPLTPEVAVGSTRLPGTFHRDPADQIIVATARLYDWPLVTVDHRIRAYPHVWLGP